MPSPIEALQSGGYSNDEISAWSAEKRQALKNGGFADNEIDAYFTGGVVAPTTIPQAFHDRIAAGEEAGKREAGLIQTVPQFANMIMTPEGRGRLWEAVKQYPSEWLKGAIETLKVPGKVASGEIDLNTEEGMDQALGLGMLIGLGRFSKINKTGKTSGLAVAKGEPIARVEKSPTGEVFDQPIGGLPDSQGFVDAAKVVNGGDAAMATQQKLLKLYEELGRLPAEVAHDAQTDPVILQRLLSKDPRDLPYIEAYHGSPHEFEQFDVSKVGTGEGAQSFGHGLYFAEHPEVAGEYQNKLAVGDRSNPRDVASSYLRTFSDRDAAISALRDNANAYSPGHEVSPEVLRKAADMLESGETPATPGGLYRVRINADREHFLDYDKPMSEQSEFVKNAIANDERLRTAVGKAGDNETVDSFYRNLKFGRPGGVKGLGGPDKASAALREAGIPGIKYLDAGSRPRTVALSDRAVAEIRDQIERLKEDIRLNENHPGVTPGFFKRTKSDIAALQKEIGENQTSNFVVFDDKLVEVTHKNGEPLTRAEHAAAMSDMGGAGGGQPPQGPVVATVQPPPPPPPPGAPMTLAQAQQAIHSKINIGGRGGPGYTVSQFYRDFVDDLYPLKGYSEDAYQAARRTRGDVGRANYFLEQSTTDFNTYRNNGPSLREVLEPVRDDLDGLRDYLAAKRALELEGRGINSGFDPAAAQTVVTAGQRQYGRVGQQLVDYQNRVLAYLRDAGVISDSQYLAITDANKSYIPFNRAIQPDDIMGHRQGGGLGAGDPIKRLVGSDRDIVDPLESIIKNTYIYVAVAERNAAGLTLIDELQRQGYRATNPAPDARDKIGAYRNGKRVEMAVDDPELVTAFKALDRDTVGTIAKILSYPASWLRAGAILTPEFMARNPIRDLLSAFVFSARGIFSPVDTAKGLVGVLRRDADWQNWIKSGGANSTLVGLDRQYLQESLAKLNAATGLMNRSWNVIKSPIEGLRMISELTENATRLGEFKKVMQGQAGKPAMEEAAFSSREVTLDFARMGAKMRAWNAISAFANAHIQGPDRLARAFIDRPINTSAKVLAGITLPSAYLWWVNHDDPRYKELPQWQKDLFWIILTDDWKPISAADAGGKPAHMLRERSGQLQFNNGIIGRVPKPFDIGVIFGSGVERALDYMYGNNPEAFDGFTKSVMNTLIPNVIPTVAVPLYEQWANRSTFTDRTLIPAYVEKQLPEYQYTPYTTELSKKLSQFVSAFPGNVISLRGALPAPLAALASTIPSQATLRTAAVEPGNVAGPMARGLTTPILVENYVRAWSGGLGMYVMQGTDALMRKAGVLPDPVKPTDTLADIPFVKAFVVRYPSASAESIQRFHDDYQENKRYFDTWTAKAKEGDVEAMARIKAAGGDAMFVQLDKINETISEHSKMVRDVYKYPMPAEEKRQLIDSFYYNMIQIAHVGRQINRQVKQQLQ